MRSAVEGQRFELRETHDRVALPIERCRAAVAARDDRGFEARLGRNPVLGADRADMLDRRFHPRELLVGARILELGFGCRPLRRRQQLICLPARQLLP